MLVQVSHGGVTVIVICVVLVQVSHGGVTVIVICVVLVL